MAHHFYMSSSGTRGDGPTVTGTKRSGISAHVRGWRSGVEVRGRHTPEGRDVFDVYATSGSGGHGAPRRIATVDADGTVYHHDTQEAAR